MIYLVKIPPDILKKLYVKDSLKNIEDGFQFELRNVLADATIVGPIKISIDDKDIDPGRIKLVIEENEINSKDISSEKPVIFRIKKVVKIKVKDEKLEPGSHNIRLETATREYGNLKQIFEATV